MTAGTLLSGQVQGDRIELSAGGSWTAEYAGAIEPQVDAATRGINARSIAINLTRIEYLDTYGAWLIERTLRSWTDQGRDARLVGLREDYRGLFEKVHAGTQTLTPPPPRPTTASSATLESVGMTMSTVGADLMLFAQMLGSTDGRAGTRVVAADDLSSYVDGQPARARRLARGADHPADHRPDRRHSRAAGHFPFPQIRRRHLCRRHGRRAGAARSRRADRLHHGRRPLRQLLYRRARRHAHARGSRRAAHDGFRSRSKC